MFSITEDKCPEAIPERGKGMVFNPGKGRHPEIEPPVAVSLAPKHKLHEKIIHHATRRLWEVAHEIDRQFFLFCTAPDVGKGDDLMILSDDTRRELFQILRVKESQREPLFSRGFMLQPGI